MADMAIGRLTMLAYLLLLTIGSALSLAGVVTNDVAAGFKVDTAIVGYCFTFFSVGYAIAILGNGFILNKFDVRKELLTATALIVIAVLGAVSQSSLVAFAIFIFLYGLGSGVLCSISYYLIINLYTEEVQRTAKLNILNFFFSVGAIVTPILAGAALARGMGWKLVMLGTLIPVLAVAFFAYSQQLKMKFRGDHIIEDSSDAEVWNAKIYVIGLAILCYVVSEMSYGYWVVMYIMEKLTVGLDVASSFLSIFWVFMAIGRFLAGVFIAKVNIVNYLLWASGLSSLAAFALVVSNKLYLSMVIAAVMGLGYSGIYATLVAYGTELLNHPSSKLTTFFLTIGAGAGVLAFVVSSYLKQVLGMIATMGFVAILMVAVFTFTLLAGKIMKC
ncbi:MAG: major facilitator superfamily 1 [Firmicutes bacterium]|nr:major facilitator superfamily 1 [Bacillota bacterium]